MKAPFCSQCGNRWHPVPKHLVVLVELLEDMRQREHDARRKCEDLQPYLEDALNGKWMRGGKMVAIPKHLRRGEIESRQRQMSFPKKRYEIWHARCAALLKLLKKEGLNKPPKPAKKKRGK